MGALSRQTGIPVLSQIPWGAHICLFYETKQDLLDSHVAYFKAGLQANERCLWAISDPVTERDARDALSQGVPDFARHLAEGRIEFLSGREWYLKGNEFDLQRITGGWHEKLRAKRFTRPSKRPVTEWFFWIRKSPKICLPVIAKVAPPTRHWKRLRNLHRAKSKCCA